MKDSEDEEFFYQKMQSPSSSLLARVWRRERCYEYHLQLPHHAISGGTEYIGRILGDVVHSGHIPKCAIHKR